jgi:RNA polymerase sigma-70 factor (ECF subfamily)
MFQNQLPYHLLSDSELFSLSRHENAEAFEVLYTRYWPALTDTASRKLQSRQKAEDIAQEILISLYNKRSALEFTSSLSAYLKQALKFKISNEFRSMAVRSAYTKNLFFNDFCKNDFAERLEAKELRSKIECVLQQLPEKCRQAFYLSRNENMSNKEIAEEMNISVSTVEKHIGKALRVLRENLELYAD